MRNDSTAAAPADPLPNEAPPSEEVALLRQGLTLRQTAAALGVLGLPVLARRGRTDQTAGAR